MDVIFSLDALRDMLEWQVFFCFSIIARTLRVKNEAFSGYMFLYCINNIWELCADILQPSGIQDDLFPIVVDLEAKPVQLVFNSSRFSNPGESIADCCFFLGKHDLNRISRLQGQQFQPFFVILFYGCCNNAIIICQLICLLDEANEIIISISSCSFISGNNKINT